MKYRNDKSGFIWHIHKSYARSACKHRTEYAMRKCAERVERRRAKEER